MKKYTYLFLALATVVLLSACQAEVDERMNTPGTDSTGTTTSNRIKTYTESYASPTEGSYSASFNVTYDNSNRITALVSATSPETKFVYAYPSAQHATGDIYNDGALTIHEDFFLNSLGYLDSTFQYNNTEDTTTEKYFYSASGQLANVKEYEYTSSGPVLDNTTTYTYDAAGNQIKSEDSNGNVETSTYYTDLLYTPPMVGTPGSAAFAKKANLVKTRTVVSNGSPVTSLQYTYSFDDRNRISTEKAVASDGSTVIKSYTYY